jgi:hypothetical protein
MSITYPPDLMNFGISSSELGLAVNVFLYGAVQRVAGVGAEQYEKRDKNGDPFQAFEEMTPFELVTMAREEVQDLGVYAAMTDLRLARLQASLKGTVVGDAR